MNQFYLVILAFAPLFLIGLLLVGLKWSAKKVMPIGLLATILVAFFSWNVPKEVILASSLQGVSIALDIGIIIFGALALINLLKYSGALNRIKSDFQSLSEDFRIQTVIVAWLFGSFLEGAAGFGTPAAIVAPLLVSIGYPVGAALLAGMMTMSTAVTFGAIGTPILVGVQGGLKVNAEQLLDNGMPIETFVQSVTNYAGLMHAVIGSFMPIVMILMLNRFYGKNKTWKIDWKLVPFLFLAGLSFTVPYALTAIYLGPEFPSIIGASFGLLLTSWFIRRGWLMPKEIQKFPEGNSQIEIDSVYKTMSTWKAWLPYMLVGTLLILSRIKYLELGTLLKSVHISIDNMFDTGISFSSFPMYLPGTIMLLVFVISTFIYRMTWITTRRALMDSTKSLSSAMLVLIFTLPLVRIFINSDQNTMDYLSMPVAIADALAAHLGDWWIVLAPVVGAFGAFIAGSNTISNLTFSELQYNIAINLNYNPALIVALQAVGAAAGNMIAIHNVVAASATVGLVGNEGSVIRKTIIPTAYYVLFLIIIAATYNYFY